MVDQPPVPKGIMRASEFKSGVIDSVFLRSKRRYAIVIVTGIAAILTPPDLLSMCSLAVPMLLLYEGAIFAVQMVERKRVADNSST